MSFPRYYIHKMIPFHCKRGHPACGRCKQLYDEGEKFCVLHLNPDKGEFPVARPVIDISWEGQEYMVEFEFVRCFKTLAEAEDQLQQLENGN